MGRLPTRGYSRQQTILGRYHLLQIRQGEFMSNSLSDLTGVPAKTDLRTCLRPPVPEVTIAAGLLNDAVTAHLEGRFSEAQRLIEQANSAAIFQWAYSLIGKNSEYNTPRIRLKIGAQISSERREKARMPSSEMKKMLHLRYGYHCSFLRYAHHSTEGANYVGFSLPQSCSVG